MNFPSDWSGFGPKLLALRERERKFVWAYLMAALSDGRENGAEAARQAGYRDLSGAAAVRAHELLHRDEILEALQEVAARELRGLAVPAVVALSKLLAKGDHPDHRKSVEMVLNRVGLAERTQVDVTVSGQIDHVNRTDATLDALEFMQDLGVPREKQLEKFGFSGLSRYERMLLERQRKQGKSLPAPTIEGVFSEVKSDG